MKILNAGQIREWDSFTIQHEPVLSIDLMERAADKCADWIGENGFIKNKFVIFCGKGNNGGDGLAITRLLHQRGYKVSVYILEFGHLGTDDFQINLERLHQYPGIEIKFIQTSEQFPSLVDHEIIVDALFGSGLNRPLEGVTSLLVEHINQSGCTVISIDVPSGMPVDEPANGNVIKANHTLCFQVYKIAFLMPENALIIGDLHVLDIGLHPGFYDAAISDHWLIDDGMISGIYKSRDLYSHKGKFGHALIIAGSYGKMGAAILCARACLRSGAGLTTCYIPKGGYEIIQAAVPEAMAITDSNTSILTRIEGDLSKFTCIGIGPGIGTASETKKLLYEVFEASKAPLILDADALNIISSDNQLLKKIPPHSVLTPHPKEFERLFGKTANDFDRLRLVQQRAKELSIVIILKGHHTVIAMPDGQVYFNITGNAGMAKGGSGDVLTGILTALTCQLKDTGKAALLGVYLHGLAGDIAAEKYSEEAMIAQDIIENMGEAFLTVAGSRIG